MLRLSPIARGVSLGLLSAVGVIASCSAEGPPEDPGPVSRTHSALTVDQEIAKGGCTSSVVQGLSDQILEELTKCVEPGFLVKVPSGGNLVNNANHAFLEKPAADGLKAALASKPGSTLTVNSMYRTVAQQYVLWRQASCFPAVADPGRSNHETGLAFDTSDRTTWQTALEAHGFKWFGSGDPVHFDFVGGGAKDLRGRDVLAYQRLWNRNNPGDKLVEDGDWGPATEARMKKSPADGFAIGAMCDVTPPADAGVDAAPPDAGRDTGPTTDTGSDGAATDSGLADASDDSGEAGLESASEGSAGCGCRVVARAGARTSWAGALALLALGASIFRRGRRGQGQ